MKLAEDHLRTSGYDPEALLALDTVTLHRKRLPTSRLPIREDTHIEPINGRLDQLRNLSKNLLLSSLLIKNPIKHKLKVPFLVL